MKNIVAIISDYDNVQAMELCIEKHISGVYHIRYGYKRRIEYCFIEFETAEDAVTFKMMFDGEC